MVFLDDKVRKIDYKIFILKIPNFGTVTITRCLYYVTLS